MSPSPGHDRLITTWLEEQAPMLEPDGLLEATIGRIEHTRRLPGPVLLERWIPMQTQARFGAVPRAAIILVVLAVLGALLTAVVVASQPSPGPTLNGLGSSLIVTTQDGDLYLTDVGASATPRPFLTGPGELYGQIVAPTGSSYPVMSVDEGGQATFLMADLATGETRPLADGRTFGGVMDFRLSHDGSLLAVAGPDGATDNLILIPTVGGPARSLVDGHQARTVSWQPNDGGLYFAVLPSGPGAVGAQLFQVDASGGDPVLAIYSTGGIRWPSISPDGTRLGYATGYTIGAQNGPWQVYVADADGTDARRIEATPEDDSEDGPWWSPDGTRLAIVAGSGPYRVALVAVEGGGATVLSDPIEGATGVFPVWSPDSRSLLLWLEAEHSVWLMDAATGAVRDTGLTSTDWPTWQANPD